jgi:hypothetical protein
MPIPLRPRTRGWSVTLERGSRACSSAHWRVAATAGLRAPPERSLSPLAARANEEEDRSERKQSQHECRSAMDADGDESEPDEEPEPERPEKGRHTAVDAGRSEMHPKAIVGNVRPSETRVWHGVLDQRFAEPVSLSSTASADFPLPGTALGLGFDLLALRARRKRQPTKCKRLDQVVGKGHGRNLRNFPFSTFPQPIVQHVEKAVGCGQTVK